MNARSSRSKLINYHSKYPLGLKGKKGNGAMKVSATIRAIAMSNIIRLTYKNSNNWFAA
jgi:hypothetical protein